MARHRCKPYALHAEPTERKGVSGAHTCGTRQRPPNANQGSNNADRHAVNAIPLADCLASPVWDFKKVFAHTRRPPTREAAAPR